MTRGTELDARGLCMAAAVVLCGAAAVLILAILIGDSRDLAWKSITFAFVFALFTLPAAAGVYLARRRPGLLLLGALTTIAAVAAFIATIAAIWPGNVFEGGGGDFKTAAVLTLISIGSGQASLILALGRPDDSPRVAGLRWVALIPIAALTIIGAEDVSHHGGPSTSTYGVLGVLYVLGVALPPLVERATRTEDDQLL